ncbi:SDR family NAD(P)-dependent oxidoreductase [Suttonella sp. R2A3]|uniref:SDR family NAD(P)-dependent oxidoreductase n=1 Tax=Suttonella sp. R2A3 TaxID=2908648 RepID=UPI001F1E67ED|nr:SDR family NAD(P)-dependent oxidoreductase [Suttonella sp. R2A3]UJF24602.1 SDR family NAD(P)-dependent oxidoreductase [Suttonella sp. R2A3]
MSESIILITGACGGIGKALSHHWDKQGDKHLILLDNDAMALQALDESLSGDHTLAPFDLWAADPDQYHKLATMIAEDYGRLDALVHVAGFCGYLRPMMQCDAEHWLKGLQINLTAPLWLTQHLCGLLQAGTSGHVVFTLHREHQQQSAYWHSFGVAHTGLTALIQSLYDERNAYPEIGFSCVDPGWVNTGMSRSIFPAGEDHWREPADIVALYDQALASNIEALEIITP